MSQDPNSPPVTPNPYAPGADGSALGAQAEATSSEAEQIRKEHLKHEASIQGMGTLYALGGGIGILLSIFYLGMGVYALASPSSSTDTEFRALGAGIFIVIGLLVGGIGALQLWTGLGLRKLKSYARIPGIVLACIGLLGFPIGTLISGYFLYLLASVKGSFILSPEYAAIRQQTPHIKYRTSIIVWIFLGLLLTLIAVGIIAAIVGS